MDNWQYHNGKMKELKQLYLKTSKQTQNRLQEIIDTFKFNFDTLYNVADNKTKNRINTYIEEWKDRGILTGYFGILAKNIYNRTRVKNSEILELLIYGAYIEEQAKIKEQELNIMYDDVNYYYQEGQQEVNDTLPKKQRKPINTLEWALFLSLLDTPNAKGYIFEQYIQATIQFNAQQIYRQMTIDLQQQKQPDIINDVYQSLIKRQNNSKLNISEDKASKDEGKQQSTEIKVSAKVEQIKRVDKISGDIDAQLIGLNNLAKVEGIKEVDNDAQVRFIAVIDGNETDMCHSLDGQLFYINKENAFNRYYGETQKDLRIERVKCFGLVTGLNLPPISHHFHWCRSTITYKIPIEKQKKTEYNILNYIRKNKYTNNKILDTSIKRAMKILPKHIKELIKNTRIQIIYNNSYYDRKHDIIYLLKDADKYEILHEIGHAVETKLDILHDDKYIEIQKEGLEDINPITDIDKIEGYGTNDFIKDTGKFISEYQRRVYEEDIDKNSIVNYINFAFNSKTLGEYFAEGFRCYFEDNNFLKEKDLKLYNYIKGVLK